MENFLNKIQGGGSGGEDDELSLLRATNAMLSHTVERYRQAIGDVERVLGTYFAGLDPKILEHPALHDISAPYRIPRVRRGAPVRDYSPRDAVRLVDSALQAVEMHPLMVESLDELRDAMHIRARLAGQTVLYRISAAALAHMPLPLLVNNIAEAIARQLTAQLRRDSHD